MAAINALNEKAGQAAFEQRTLEQGAATSVWAAVVATENAIGHYCEDCHVAEINEGDGLDGVRALRWIRQRLERPVRRPKA